MIAPIPAEQKERINILLAEYNTLRAELLQKYTAILQSVSIIAPILVGLVASLVLDPSRRPIYLLILSLLFIYAWAVWFFADRMINRIAARIRAIEGDVNGRAQERLLEWESRYGFGGLFNRQGAKW